MLPSGSTNSMDPMNANTRRLFIAFTLEISSGLEAAIKRTRIGAQQRRMEVNWVPKENLHVTLYFLGATPSERIPELERLIETVGQTHSAFSTSIRGMGAFPDSRHARVLWVGVRNSRALNQLQAALRETLIQAGFPQEERDYVPHLTIGRLRKARAVDDLLSPYVRTSFDDIRVESISLFESLQHGPQTVYKVLKTFPLCGPSDSLSDDQMS